jgi:hypothetical protein
MPIKTTALKNAIRILLVILVLISRNAGTPLFAHQYIKGLPYNLNTMNDNRGNNLKKESLFQFGFGGGICLKGGSIGFDYTFIRSNNWGGNISYKSNIIKSEDIPTDWNEGGRTFYPKDYVKLLSFNLLREFSTSQQYIRFGVEGGLSWVIYSQAQLELNPSYDPDPDPEINWLYKIGTKYKYNKSHSRSNTVGVSLRVKTEFLLSHSIGFELAAFTNINSIKPTIGLELHFIFGRLKPRFYF